jgi:hypothetical protein
LAELVDVVSGAESEPQFDDVKDDTRYFGHVTDGNHVSMIAPDSLTLV